MERRTRLLAMLERVGEVKHVMIPSCTYAKLHPENSVGLPSIVTVYFSVKVWWTEPISKVYVTIIKKSSKVMAMAIMPLYVKDVKRQ